MAPKTAPKIASISTIKNVSKMVVHTGVLFKIGFQCHFGCDFFAIDFWKYRPNKQLNNTTVCDPCSCSYISTCIYLFTTSRAVLSAAHKCNLITTLAERFYCILAPTEVRPRPILPLKRPPRSILKRIPV